LPNERHNNNERQNKTLTSDWTIEPSESRPKSERFCNFIFSSAHFLKTIFTSRTNGTFAFAPSHKGNPSAKAKEPFFANEPDNNNHSSKNINSVSNKRKIIIVGDEFAEIQLVRKLDEKNLMCLI